MNSKNYEKVPLHILTTIEDDKLTRTNRWFIVTKNNFALKTNNGSYLFNSNKSIVEGWFNRFEDKDDLIIVFVSLAFIDPDFAEHSFNGSFG